MNSNYRYIFEKGSKKHKCPNCGKTRFVRYVDDQTGNYLPHQYGRCDREIKCGYSLNPYKDGYGRSEWKPKSALQKPAKSITPKPVLLPLEVLKHTRTGYDKNVFIQNLLHNVPFPFTGEDVSRVISLYHLGTIQGRYRQGSVTFPFIDKNNGIRTIQVKQFDRSNHTTGQGFLHSMLEKQHKKEKQPLPNWLDKYIKQEKKVTCLFGEHLLSKYPNNPVALVEAPKTAVYGSLYFGFPENPNNLLWLAVYSLSSLTLEKCEALKGRKVFLFPDLSKDGSSFDLWEKKSKLFQEKLEGTTFTMSNLLEENANEEDRAEGKDLADFLIKQDWRNFRNKEVAIEEEPKSICEKCEKSDDETTSFILVQEIKVEEENWEPEEEIKPLVAPYKMDISELEDFFSNTTIPEGPIKLNGCVTIINPEKFLASHFATIKANSTNEKYQPFLNRLYEFKEVITNLK